MDFFGYRFFPPSSLLASFLFFLSRPSHNRPSAIKAWQLGKQTYTVSKEEKKHYRYFNSHLRILYLTLRKVVFSSLNMFICLINIFLNGAYGKQKAITGTWHRLNLARSLALPFLLPLGRWIGLLTPSFFCFLSFFIPSFPSPSDE